MKKYTVTAHTGSEGTRANSLKSIITAAANGADVVEFDLLYAKDGTPVMRHSRPVPANAARVEKGFEIIAKTNLRVNIDVKDPAHIAETLELAEKYGIRERCFFTGVGEDWVETVKQQCGGNKYYLNYFINVLKKTDAAYLKEIALKVKNSGAIGLNTEYHCISKELLKALHDEGLELSVWTVNNIDSYREMVKLGVDNITTCHPSFEQEK